MVKKERRMEQFNTHRENETQWQDGRNVKVMGTKILFLKQNKAKPESFITIQIIICLYFLLDHEPVTKILKKASI